MELLLILGGLVALGILAERFGYDSRDDFTRRDLHRPRHFVDAWGILRR